MLNVGLMKFMKRGENSGNLVAIESARDIPFEIKRIYYITNVPSNVIRGCHSHTRLHQVLLCLNGSVTIHTQNGNSEKLSTVLSVNSEGLYIGPNIWREMSDFASGTVLLVLASEYYDESDYIRNYEEYLKSTTDFFK